LNGILVISLLLCLSLTAFAAPGINGATHVSRGGLAQIHDFPMGTALRDAATAAGLNVSLNYDEQLGLSYTQSPINGLKFNVTAVEQSFSDSYGAGPGYLVSGLSDSGYWYEAGIAWNWPSDNGGYQPGFSFLYEVFDNAGNSIFPADGGGGLLNFTAPVNANDSVNIALSFSGGNVTMTGYDWDTSASASVSFSAEGATYFTGTPYDGSNAEGYFTGLMTEQYHADPYYGNVAEVTYSESGTAFSSAWMWIDEYNSVLGTTQFSSQTISPLSYANPTQLQSFTSNGATEYSDAYEFITGQMTSTTTTSTTSSSASVTVTSTVTSTATLTSTQTLTTTLPITTTQTATVTLPVTTTVTSTQSTTLTTTSTVTLPPVTATSTQTESITSTVIQTSQTVPLWMYLLPFVTLFAGLGIGYVVWRSAAQEPRGAGEHPGPGSAPA
jgi:hypothetical protein